MYNSPETRANVHSLFTTLVLSLPLSYFSLHATCLCRSLSFFCFTLYSHAIAVCLATIVLDSCGKSGVAKAISSPPLDKIQTFTRGDVVLRKGRGSKKKVKSANYTYICLVYVNCMSHANYMLSEI